jgi:ElaB/YqjD/DUF883 family membrane-anchored ribosome-binding protein
MSTERSYGTGGTSSRLGQEFERAKDSISGAAANAKDNLGDDLSNLRDDISRLSDTVTQLARQVASDVGSVAGAGTTAAKSVASEVENIVRRNPLGTLAGVFIAGLLIGMLRGR